MRKQTAVAVLQIEAEFIVLLFVTSVFRTVQTLIAVNEGTSTFDTAPDFPGWVNSGTVRVLRTKDLPANLVEEMRRNFISQQIAAFESTFEPFEFASNKTLAGRTLFSIFGKGGGSVGRPRPLKARSAFTKL